METFDERLDEAFETHLRGVPVAGLVWMEEEVAWEMRRARARPEGPHPGEAKVLPSSAAAERTLVRHLVRNAIREVWEGRIKAVDREAALVAAARRGEVEVPADLREPCQRLADAVWSRNLDAVLAAVRDVCAPLVPGYSWDRPAGARTRICDGIRVEAASTLVLLAGRVLRDGGRLEDAHACYHWSRRTWHEWTASPAADDNHRVGRYAWQWGLPVYVESDRGSWVRSITPNVKRFDWRPYDHVVGCGTTIRHNTLKLLGVPLEKQHIVETHHWLPRPVDGTFPRLRGRVAVVDDVHEGQTAFTLARLYEADVVDVGNWACTHITSRRQPVCHVDDPAVLADVMRPRVDPTDRRVLADGLPADPAAREGGIEA